MFKVVNKKVFSFWPMFALVCAVVYVMTQFVTPIHIVETGSMVPTITPLTYIVDIPVGAVRQGDVITFHETPGGALVTHRVFAINSNGSIETKGDANATPDFHPVPLTMKDVVGVVLGGAGIPVVIFWMWAVIAGLAALMVLLVRRHKGTVSEENEKEMTKRGKRLTTPA